MPKMLRRPRKKVAPEKIAKAASKRFVLVGTYAKGQLERRPGYYNYPLFGKDKIETLYAPSRDFAESVIIRTKDFAGQGATQKQLKDYLESPDRKDPLLAKMLPKIVTELPRERLRVCEAAVQLDFLGMVET